MPVIYDVLCQMRSMDIVMNKEFVKKIIMAEKLKYEAIKEILPDNLRERVEAFEKETFNLVKDIALEMIKERREQSSSSEIVAVKKVNIDFT